MSKYTAMLHYMHWLNKGGIPFYTCSKPEKGG